MEALNIGLLSRARGEVRPPNSNNESSPLSLTTDTYRGHGVAAWAPWFLLQWIFSETVFVSDITNHVVHVSETRSIEDY